MRELENALEHALVLASGGVIGRDDLPPAVRASRGAVALRGREGADLTLQGQMEVAEAAAIHAALERVGGNRRQAAALLGISVRTLFYRLRRLGIHQHDGPGPSDPSDREHRPA